MKSKGCDGFYEFCHEVRGGSFTLYDKYKPLDELEECGEEKLKTCLEENKLLRECIVSALGYLEEALNINTYGAVKTPNTYHKLMACRVALRQLMSLLPADEGTGDADLTPSHKDD